jgi:hypothetical protein
MPVRAGYCHFSSSSEPIACIENTDKSRPKPFLNLCCFIRPRLTPLNSKPAGIKLTRAPYGEVV